MAAYGSLVTNIGEAKITNGFYLGRKVDITHMAVGDGGGAYYQPTRDMTELKNEVWRGRVNLVEKEDSSNVVTISAYIPTDVGGFTIREAAAFDANGNMIAVMNTPDTQKVTAAFGAQSDLYVSIPIAVSHADVITLITDPSVIMATRKDLSKLLDKMETLPIKTIISDAEPTEPCNVWLKPMGGISIPGGLGDGGIAQLNLQGVHYGENPPQDKTQLWVKPITE